MVVFLKFHGNRALTSLWQAWGQGWKANLTLLMLATEVFLGLPQTSVITSNGQTRFPLAMALHVLSYIALFLRNIFPFVSTFENPPKEQPNSSAN